MRFNQFIRQVLLLGLFVVLVSPAANALSEAEKRDGFVSMFNGKDLSGWKIMGKEKAWKIEDGAIHALPGLRGGHIQSERALEDFIFRLEYKTGKNANSGVFIHIPRHGRQSRVGGEIQIYDSYGKPPSKSSAGALYDKVPPLVTASRPTGEWNEMEIFFQYPRLKVTLNETIVQNLDVSQDERIKWRNRIGPFGLQEHGNHAWFRNIRVKDLGGKNRAPWHSLFPEKNLEGWHAVGTAPWKLKESKTILSIKNAGAERGVEFPKDLDRWNLLGNAKWKIKEACMVGKYGTGYLVSDERYQNYHLWAYVKTSPEALGGIWFRWIDKDNPGDAVTLWNDRHDSYKTGSIVQLNNRRRIEKILAPSTGKYTRDGDWFPIQIIVKDGKVTVVVNGNVMSSSVQVEDLPAHIALGVTTKSGTTVSIKGIRIQKLD